MPEPETNKTQPAAATANASPEGGENAAAAPGAAPNPPPSSAAAPEVSAESAVAAAKAEAAAYLDRFMRVAADLENFRRRTVREKDELRNIVTGRVLEDIFPVLDSLALALNASKQPGADLKSLVGGVEIVLAQLRTALGAHGLKEISPAGQPFDPHFHEAISHQPSESVQEEHVLDVVRTGYSLNGRLLRPASVVVSSGPAKEAKA